MKKHLKLILLFVIVHSFTFAQNKSEYGFLTGVNFNSIQKNSLYTLGRESLSSSKGISLEAYYKRNINASSGVKIMAQYDQNGYRFGGPDLSLIDPVGNIVKAEIVIRNSYLNIPIVAEYKFGKKVKGYFNAGPFIGFLTCSEIIIQYFPVNQPTSKTKGKSDSYKSTNFGISFGGGLLVPITKKMQLNFAAKNNFGLISTIKQIPTDNSKFKTNAFSLLLGINICL